MYLPYIRAKQYDLGAIQSISAEIYNSNTVLPIIEPVTQINATQYRRLRERDIPFILVVNPIVGPLYSLTPHAQIVNLLRTTFAGYANIRVGFIIHPTTTLPQVTNFINSFPTLKHSFIHFAQFPNSEALAELIEDDDNKEFNIFIDGEVSLDYVNDFLDVSTSDILIRDGFNRRAKNELYPAQDFFDDLHKNYEEIGYNGFGDFTVIGKDFISGGGPAYVVAIHLTDLNDRNDIIVRHFKSDLTPPLTQADPGGKFRFALAAMMRHLRAVPTLTSDGIDEYRVIHRAGNFPGLGVPKKLSIMHHIETIYNQM